MTRGRAPPFLSCFLPLLDLWGLGCREVHDAIGITLLMDPEPAGEGAWILPITRVLCWWVIAFVFVGQQPGSHQLCLSSDFPAVSSTLGPQESRVDWR